MVLSDFHESVGHRHWYDGKSKDGEQKVRRLRSCVLWSVRCPVSYHDEQDESNRTPTNDVPFEVGVETIGREERSE